MKKSICYCLTKNEMEELLQNELDNNGIRLVRRDDVGYGSYYEAESDIQYLDGEEIDQRLAAFLHENKECEHWAIDEDRIVILIKNGAGEEDVLDEAVKR